MTVKPITGFKINGETQPVSYPHLHGKTAVEFTEQTLTDEQKRQARLNIDAPVTGDLDAAKKQIENLKKLAQGKLYDFETDRTEAYAKTVPVGAAPYAAMKAIGGKSIVMNQLAYPEPYPTSTNGISCSLEDGVFTFTGTQIDATVRTAVNLCSNSNHTGTNTVKGHKYLCRIRKLTSHEFSADTLRIADSWSGHAANKYDSFIFDGNGSLFMPTLYVRYGDSYEPYSFDTPLKMSVETFDLTNMFGAGNEPSTVEEFKALLPAEYYEYNEGEIVSAGVQNVKSAGTNLLDYGKIQSSIVVDEETISKPETLYNYDIFTGTVSISAPVDDLSKVLRLAKGTYTLAYESSSIPIVLQFCILNDDGSFSSNIELSRNVKYLTLTLSTNTYATIRVLTKESFEVKKLQLVRGDAVPSFNTYHEDNLTIPEAVKQLEGYGWSVGTARNWVDFEKKVYHREVGKYEFDGAKTVSAGTVTDSYALYHCSAGVTDRFGDWSCSGLTNLFTLANAGFSIPYQWAWTNANSDLISFSLPTSYDSVESVKAWFKSLYDEGKPVTLYYQLAEPVEIDISDILTDDNLIEVETGGTLTFENIHGDSFRLPVPSSVEYMVNLEEAVQ